MLADVHVIDRIVVVDDDDEEECSLVCVMCNTATATATYGTHCLKTTRQTIRY